MNMKDPDLHMPSSSIVYKEHFFNASDGIRLFYRRWYQEDSKGTVLLIHGYAEHSGRYRLLADVLSAAGWSVAAMDYRGHGQSGGRRAHVDDFNQYMEDMRSFVDEVNRDELAKDPMVLLGHSQGGLIAARFGELEPELFSCIILSSPFLGFAITVPAYKAWMGQVASKLMPTLSMPSGLDPAWLSHDKSMVQEYIDDPLVSNIATARWFTEVQKAQAQTMDDVKKFTAPLLVLQAGQDRLSLKETSEAFCAGVSSKIKRFELFEDMYHEIFNEIDRQVVFDLVVSWLDQQITKLHGGIDEA